MLIPSVNFTLGKTFGNWIWPSRRRQPFSRAFDLYADTAAFPTGRLRPDPDRGPVPFGRNAATACSRSSSTRLKAKSLGPSRSRDNQISGRYCHANATRAASNRSARSRRSTKAPSRPAIGTLPDQLRTKNVNSAARMPGIHDAGKKLTQDSSAS
jgi:hypothetical protein